MRKRAVWLAKKKGFDKIVKFDVSRVSIRTCPELRILRWDQAMLQWPHFNNDILQKWIKNNLYVLNTMAMHYYAKNYKLFKASGWELQDLQNVLLWHAYVYLNTPSIKYKNSDNYVWSHIKQRAIEVVQILQKKATYDVLPAALSGDATSTSDSESDDRLFLVIKNKINRLFDKYGDLLKTQYATQLIRKINRMNNVEQQKNFLLNKLKFVRLDRNKKILKILLSAYELA